MLARAASAANPQRLATGSNGIQHVVVLMMENRSFDHFLGWLPSADGRHDLAFPSTDGNVYRNYPLAPDFQGCGYSDPDHGWEGFLVEYNGGRMDGFLQRPCACRKCRPCRSSSMSVLVEDTAKSIASADVEVVELGRFGDWLGQRAQWCRGAARGGSALGQEMITGRAAAYPSSERIDTGGHPVTSVA